MIISGTIRSAVKLDVMNQKWQQKKENLSAVKKQKKPLTQEEQMLQMFKEDLHKMREGNEVEEIANKMKAGRELTADELKVLQEKSPELYQEYIKIQSEKEAYRRQLRNCKTKEEVDNLKLQKMGQFAAEAKRVENNPYISEAKKKEIFERMLMRMQGLECEYQEFKKSLEFVELPTEQEKAEERERQAEAYKQQAVELGQEQMEGVQLPEKEAEVLPEETEVSESNVSEESGKAYVSEKAINSPIEPSMDVPSRNSNVSGGKSGIRAELNLKNK